MRRHGIDEVSRARPALDRRPRVVLAGGDRGSGDRLRRAVGSGRRRLERARVGDLVRRREAEHRLELRPPMGGGAAGDAEAVVGLGEDGERGQLTYAELSREVRRLAGRLLGLGVAPGDRVAIFLPMSPEVAIASHACAHVGAVQVPIFSGFAAPAVAQRLVDSGAKVAITAETSQRRGRTVPMLAILEEARREAPELEHVRRRAVGRRVAGAPGTLDAARRRLGASLHPHVHLRHDRPAEGRRPRPGRFPRLDRARGRLPGRHPGGRRRPLRHRHGLDHGAVDARRLRRAGRDGGPRRGRAGLAARPALAAGREREGDDPRLLPHARPRPDPARRAARPTSRRCARSSRPANHGIPIRTAGCTSRSAAAAARSSTSRAGPRSAPASSRRRWRCRSRRARSAARHSGWRWTSSTTRGARSSGRGEVGELVCRKPFPGMTRGFWRDPERYLDTYWRRFPGIWTHGDWASVDEDGYWFLHGRSDDTLNIAGKRIGPAELESAASRIRPWRRRRPSRPARGEGRGARGSSACSRPAPDAARGGAARPRRRRARQGVRTGAVVFVPALPKTRSAKIVRRAVRATALGEDPGDMSSVENPEALDRDRRARCGRF